MLFGVGSWDTRSGRGRRFLSASIGRLPRCARDCLICGFICSVYSVCSVAKTQLVFSQRRKDRQGLNCLPPSVLCHPFSALSAFEEAVTEVNRGVVDDLGLAIGKQAGVAAVGRDEAVSHEKLPQKDARDGRDQRDMGGDGAFRERAFRSLASLRSFSFIVPVLLSRRPLAAPVVLRGVVAAFALMIDYG